MVLPFATAVLPLLAAATGVGITEALTNCGRVGFKTAEYGKFLEDQPFESHFGDSKYGLKRLRTAMASTESTALKVRLSAPGVFLSVPDDLLKPDKSES